MEECDLIILGGANLKGKPIGHLNLFQTANYLNEKKIKNVIYTNFSFGDSEVNLVSENLKKVNATYGLASDGKTLQVFREEQLMQNFNGLHFPENHAKMIWQGNESLIVREKYFTNVVGKLFYIVGSNLSYGVIRIVGVNPISLQEFSSLSEQHRVTEQERSLWWSGKKKLFAYEFKMVNKFDAPILTDVPNSDEFFMEQVNFLNDLTIREGKVLNEIDTYDSKKVDFNSLKEDFRIFLSWCEKGLYPEKSKTLLANSMKELLSVGVVFYPEKMSENQRKIFDEIKGSFNKEKQSENNNSFQLFEKIILADNTKRFSNKEELLDEIFG
jgi:hypothetical protein